jgi:thiopeptide-type bacteriocin biosynthesis protein
MNDPRSFYLPDPDETSAEIESRWIEIRCAVPVESTPLVPWVELRSAVQVWRQSGLLDQFFFVRKPPGLRLRFRSKNSQADFLNALDVWLGLMVQKNRVVHFQSVTYESEVRRFGGNEGMAIAHQHWSDDTETILDYECIPSGSRGTIPRTALWVTLVNHLFRETLDDSAEIWDVWCRLNEAFAELSSEFGKAKTIYDSVAPGMFSGPEHWKELLSPILEAIVTRARNSNSDVANQLTGLSRKGGLKIGVRSWLTANTIFQANRWGLGLNPPELRAAVSAMCQYLEPDSRKTARNPSGEL